jgi:hypothetical protein
MFLCQHEVDLTRLLKQELKQGVGLFGRQACISHISIADRQQRPLWNDIADRMHASNEFMTGVVYRCGGWPVGRSLPHRSAHRLRDPQLNKPPPLVYTSSIRVGLQTRCDDASCANSSSLRKNRVQRRYTCGCVHRRTMVFHDYKRTSPPNQSPILFSQNTSG